MKKYLIALSIFISFSTISQAEVQVYALEIQGLHQKDGGGEYDQIIDKAVVQSGLAKIQVLPPARAEAEFVNCTNCCLSPSNLNPDFYNHDNDTVATKPMNTAKVYIFTGKGQNVIKSLDELKGKRVGARNGMPYGKKFEMSGIEPQLTSDITKNIRKLDSGRIDAFIAYVPDAYLVFEELGVPPYPHDKANPIAVHPDSMVCRGTSEVFINTFNAALD